MITTIICVTNYEELPFFFEVPGDQRHLDGIVCGTARKDTEAFAREFALYQLLFKPDGNYRFPKLTFTDVVTKINAEHCWHAITVGWCP